MRIGLLGGSFNPAHEGHRHISLLALQRLNLHRVWWLVSPQNPSKSSKSMASLDQRLARAENITRHPRIIVTDLERQFATTFTADTLEILKARWPGVYFTWLMGADNLSQFAEWRNWTWIAQQVPIAVFNRPSYSFSALHSKAARRLYRYRRPVKTGRSLPFSPPPAWIFFHDPMKTESATHIREKGKEDWPPLR